MGKRKKHIASVSSAFPLKHILIWNNDAHYVVEEKQAYSLTDRFSFL